MDCSMIVPEESNSEAKQNVSVIFVPESILLAISKSTEDSSEDGEISTSESRNSQEIPEDDGPKIQSSVSEKATLNTDSTFTFPIQQSSSFFVLDPGEWFANADLTSGTASENEAAVLPKQNGPSPTAAATVTNHQLRSIKPRPKFNCDNRIITKTIATDLEIAANTEDSTGRDGNSDSKSHKCTVNNCSKTFNSEQDLSVHSLRHKKGNTHPCTYPGCPWTFSTPYKLQRHEKSHTRTKPFKCTHPGCKVRCSTKYNLTVHQKYHSVAGYIQCDKCDMTFKSRMKMTKHLRLAHNSDPMYKCQFPSCDKKFHTHAAQKVHEKTHSKMKYICGVEDCGKEFRLPALLKEHFMSVHSGLRPFKCDFPGCSWDFTTNSKLTRHAITHSKERNYACPVEDCPARFSRKEHLRSHLRKHNCENSKKQDCTEAPIELNLGDWVYYFCPYDNCGSLFTTPTGAKQHIIKCHSSTKQTAANTSPSKDRQPLTVLSSGVAESIECQEIPVKIVTSALVEPDHCETSTSVCSEAVDKQSILRTLMEAEPSTELAANETINTTSLPPTLNSQPININLVATNSGAHNVAIEPESSTSIMASPTTVSAIVPSQLLLDAAAEFATISTEDDLRDSAEFLNSVYSSQNAVPEGFLTFTDCVQIVDPNAVMSLRAPVPQFQQIQSSGCDTSGDESDGVLRDVVSKTKSSNVTSGSARTDCNAYRWRRNTKKSSPVKIYEGRSTYMRGKTLRDFGIGPTINCSNFNKKIPVRSAHVFKNRLQDKGFAESTINLNDLA